MTIKKDKNKIFKTIIIVNRKYNHLSFNYLITYSPKRMELLAAGHAPPGKRLEPFLHFSKKIDIVDKMPSKAILID